MRIGSVAGGIVVVVGLVVGAGSARGEEGTARSPEERRAAVDAATAAPVEVAPPAWRVVLVGGAADGEGPPAGEPSPREPRSTPPVDVVAAPPAGGPAPTAPVYAYGGGWSPTGRAEDTRLGPWHQPEWTTERRFTRVRTYVIAPGQVEFESWWYYKDKKHGDPDEQLYQEEIAVGLPHGFQLDVYGNFLQVGGGDVDYFQTQLEMRKALAPWGCLPLNPTLYFEYKIAARKDDPDAAELKLLLSEDLAPRWVFGANLAYERELSGEKEEVWAASAATSYSVLDQRFYVGVEAQVERVTVDGGRNDPEYEVIVGPSLQLRFGPRTHLDVAPLFGVTDAAPNMKLYVIFGVDIGPKGADGGWLNPVSGASR